MAPLHIIKVVNFSSTDPLIPASNLLGKGKGQKHWEYLAAVLLQPSTSTNIDIVNARVAFIEVQVGMFGPKKRGTL